MATTRKRNQASASNGASGTTTSPAISSSEGSTSRAGIDTSNNSLPPSRPSKEKKAMRPVSPPLANTRLSRLIYILVLLTFLLGTYYSYRLVQYKTQVGGWWNMALGRGPEYVKQQQAKYKPSGSSSSNGNSGSSGGGGLESQINALAKSLGMPPHDLARAIAIAVREHVPPASLSSVAAKETGIAVDALLGGAQGKGFEYLKKAPAKQESNDEGAQAKGAEGIVDGVVHGMESFVGMDEP